jgi:tetratricopeptide (TPR) repeat protein
LEELATAFESVQSGHGQFLGIVGEPGMGKSTVSEVFLDQLRESESECLVGSGKSSERHGETSAYMPVIEALSELVNSDKTGEIARDLAKYAPTWHGLVFTGHDEDHDVKSLRANSQGRMQHELGALLSRVCARQPLVIFFDDFHWADVSTLDVLVYLADRLEKLSMLLIVSYRESELQQTEHPFLSARLSLQSRNQFHEIKLQPWSQEQVEVLMASEFPDNRFPEELFTRIFERTAGHPLFVVELIRYLKDAGTIKQENDSWVLAERIDEINDGLPGSVRNMVERKMGRISESDRRLLSAASVQGQYFDSAVLARVLETDAAEIEEQLHQMEHIYTLVKLIDEREMPDRTLSSYYSFGHIMYHDYFISNIRPSRKVTWARSTADTLSAFHRQHPNRVAAELAHLFAAARDPEKSAAQYLVAALNSSSVFAYRESKAMARNGLDELASAPESVERDRQELLVQLALGRSLCMTEGYGSHETMVCFARALELTKAMADGEDNLDLVWSLWMVYTNIGNRSMSLELSDRLQDMATDVLAGAAANLASGFANEITGNFPEARHCFQKVIDVELSDGGPERASRFVADPLILARGNQLRLLALMGRLEESNDRWKQNLALADSSSLDPRSTAGLLIEGAWFHAFYHHFDVTLSLTERTIDICTTYDFFMESQWATFLQSWANTQVGDEKQGLAGIEAFIGFIDATGALMHAPMYYAIYGDILFESGHSEEAEKWVNRGLEVMEHTGQAYFASEIYRLQGLIAAARQQIDLSLTTLKNAHQMAREQDARLLELRAALSLNSTFASTGAVDDGTRILRETVSRMHDGFQSSELREASFILKETI